MFQLGKIISKLELFNFDLQNLQNFKTFVSIIVRCKLLTYFLSLDCCIFGPEFGVQKKCEKRKEKQEN